MKKQEMTRGIRVFGIMVFGALAVSCRNPRVATDAPLPLGKALISVAESFEELRVDGERRNRRSTGLVPDEVTVSFVISSQTDKERGLTVNLAPPNVPATLGGSLKATDSKLLSNTVQVTFKNPALAPANSPYAKWDPEQIHVWLASGEVTTLKAAPGGAASPNAPVNRPRVPPITLRNMNPAERKVLLQGFLENAELKEEMTKTLKEQGLKVEE